MENKYFVELGELGSNVIMFEPEAIDWNLQEHIDSMIVYDPEVDGGEFEERVVSEIESIEEQVIYGSDVVKASEEESNADMDENLQAELSMYDTDVSQNLDESEPMFTEYVDDLVLYDQEGVEHEDFEVESHASGDEASNQLESTNEIVNKGRPSRGRKRKYPDQSRVDRKRLLNTNKTHINTKGNMYQERLFDNNFDCSCLKNCTQVVPVHDRLRLFSQYWNVGTYEGRTAYLMNFVKEVNKKRSYSKKNLKNRDKSRIYSIYGTTVCQKALLKTLQISVSRVKVALYKFMKLDTLADLRGKLQGGWNALLPSKKAEVCAHIDSFPRYVSHYTRAKTESKYLSVNLNLAKIYHLYKTDAENPVSQSTYNDIFYKCFNLRFKRPKKDTCQECDTYQIERKIKFGVELEQLEKKHEEHLKQGESLQCQMKADCADAKNDPEHECLPLDMQKTHQMPKIPTGIAYYKRQLNLNNCGIHSGSTGKGYFNLWIEDEAGKGTQEVGSCIKAHIEKYAKPRMKKLTLWSDSCGGQNRSIKLVLMMIHILHNHRTLESISMRYLLSGHSFLLNDTEFAEVETALKPHEKLFTDEDYIEVMKECRRKNQFTVNRMSPDDFFSVRSLEALITNRKVDIENKKVSWLDTHEILIEKEHPNQIKMRNQISGPFQIVNLAKRGCQLDMKNVTLDKLWPEGKPLSKEKIKDLKDLLHLVPQEYHYFYERLNVEGADFEDDIDGFGSSIDFVPELNWIS